MVKIFKIQNLLNLKKIVCTPPHRGLSKEYLTLGSISSLNNPQKNEMKFVKI
jgi:hypothetical protein